MPDDEASDSGRTVPQLRVALVASSYAPYIGGVEEHVRQVAKHLAADGTAVEVWTVERDGGHRVAEVEGITVRYLPTPLPARSASAMARFARAVPGAWAQWKQAYRQFAPDVLHVQCFGPNGIYALALHRRFGVPLGVTSHGETLGDDNDVFHRSALLRRALTDAISAAQFVTGCSQLVLDDLRSHYGLRGGDVVPNGVDRTIVPRHEASDISERTFVAVGRLGRMKGFDLLIDAFARARLPADVQLAIIGGGPEDAALRRQVRELGLEQKVRLLGARGAQQVADAMAAGLAVVVPSRREAFGIVVLEAWRSVAPLVVTRSVGAPVVDGVDALTVDPEDATAFAAVLTRVAGDGDVRASIAAAGASRVQEFSWDAVAAQYRALLTQQAAAEPR